ncbi:MAG: hypothetical protein AABO57_25525 [Acidobacteriota bacterium]
MPNQDDREEAQLSQEAQVGLSQMWRGAYANSEAAAGKNQSRYTSMNKGHRTDFKKGDEVSFAMPSGVLYGTVTRVLGADESAAVEIEFEDGRKEIKKVRDRALSLLRRASGVSEVEERHSDRERLSDPEIQRLFRSEQRRKS